MGIIKNVYSQYGTGFSNTLFRNYFFVKGVVASVLVLGTLPLFQNYYKISGENYQNLVTVSMLPWTMKPIVGRFSDSFPIYQWNKRFYIMGAAIVGSVCLAILSAVDDLAVALGMLFVVSFCIMMCDLLFEGLYSRQMAFRNKTTDVTSFVWGSIMLGGIVAAVIVGPMADNNQIQYAYALAVVLFVQLAQTTIKTPFENLPDDFNPNIKSERLLDDVENDTTGTPTPTNEWTLAITMFVCSVVVLIFMVSAPSYYVMNLIVGLSVAIILHTLAYFMYKNNKILWRSNLFLFMIEATYVNIAGATDYFYTSKTICDRSGPQFSYVFYTTYASILSGIFGIFACWVYPRLFSKWSIQSTIRFTILFRTVSVVSDFLIATRWNETKLGLSDKLVFILGDAIISPVASMLSLLPVIILTAELVIKGHEATTYAVLASFQNLGSTISRLLGVFFMNAFGVYSTSTSCSYENYPYLLILAHLVVPLVCIPFSYILLPIHVKKETVVKTSSD